MAEMALVTSADPYDVTDEKTGNQIKGTSVWFFNNYRDASTANGALGIKPSKVGCTDELFERMKTMNLPAMCEMVYGSRPGAGGKATLTLLDIKNAVSVDFFGNSIDTNKKRV